MATTDAEILEAVRTAILSVAANGGAASITVNGRTVSYQLDQLQRLEQYYGSKVNRAGRSMVKLADISQGDS